MNLARRSAVIPTASLAAAFFVLTVLPAAAQSWFGDGNSVYDREIVAFSKKYRAGQIIVSFGDRKLYHITRRGRAVSYPIAVPRQQSRWQGVLRISQKRTNPSWTPTATMRRENPKLPTFVPGGHPRNPLGVRALYLGSTLYRIHGTDAPWTIGQNVSKGCVRMHNRSRCRALQESSGRHEGDCHVEALRHEVLCLSFVGRQRSGQLEPIPIVGSQASGSERDERQGLFRQPFFLSVASYFRRDICHISSPMRTSARIRSSNRHDRLNNSEPWR